MSQFSNLRLSLAFAALMMAATVGLAQRPHPPGGGPDRERMETLRVAFMTERLELTTEEAEQFWPVMKAHQEVLETIHETLDSIHKGLVDTDSPADAWLQEQLDEIFALRNAELKEERAMIEEVGEILGLERALKLPALEGQFRHRIMEELQKRRSAGGPPPRPQRP